jgi:alkylated DNA repair dioxygenase AlkB
MSQKSIISFFGGQSNKKLIPKKSKTTLTKHKNGSSFGQCPLCNRSFPLHTLERHASNCVGPKSTTETSKSNVNSSTNDSSYITHDREPIAGLYVFENFISEEEEAQILAELDDSSISASNTVPWKPANFNGPHYGKRWGVHCNLRDRKVSAPENPLPCFVRLILMPRLKRLKPMAGVRPNEANAIDYRRKMGHYLSSHVDDRQLSKEPIANLSIAGDCYMTYINEAPHRNTAAKSARVWLPRRCLQVLTGKARYDFSHGIRNEDLYTDRRVSVTMRESPLTHNHCQP